MTAYAVRHFGAAAGVMVTASHNPAPDNGYKVYDDTGSQIIPPTDTEIAAHDRDARDRPTRSRSEPGSARITTDRRRRARRVPRRRRGSRDAAPRELRVVYTPLHGVGLDVFLALWERAGFPPPIVVDAQAKPDPDFPTAPFPNPEEPGVLDLALDLATRHRADLVLANDPDADRLAVAVPHGGGWKVLTGDEIGGCSARTCSQTTSGDDRVVARSVVSSTLARPDRGRSRRARPPRRSPGSSGSRVPVTPTAGASSSATRRRSATR